ncbi:MAG: tetratricopeptide repeat protein [Acidobacteria bacterium]|nr:tetratricopeptide repeat protein [Acidobacteriota bacterium]
MKKLSALSGIAVLCLLAGACSDPEVSKLRMLERGEALAAEGKHAEAIIQYRNALRIDARYGEARFALAKAFMETDRPREGVREYMRAAELLPERADVQLNAANLFLQAREFDRAKQAAESAVKSEPGNVEAQIALANSMAGLKDLPGAMAEIEEAIQLAPEDSRPYERLGAFRMAEGDRAKAQAAYLKAVEVAPDAVDPRVALGYFYWSGGNNTMAEAEFKRAIEIEPAHPLANRLLIAFYASTGRQSEMEAPLLRLADAQDPDAILAVADQYARTNRADQARPLYERLLENKARRGVATGRLARVEYAQGRREDAHARLDGSLKEQAEQTDLLNLKSAFLLTEQRFQESHDFAQRAVSTAPESASAHYALGLTQMALRQPEAAAQSFRETLRLNPRAAAADIQLSRLSLASGDATQAVRYAEAARQTQPQNPDARLALATALLRQGQVGRAEAEAKALRSDFPDTAAVHALQGSVALARSNNAAATAGFQRALAIDPANLQALGGLLTVDARGKRFVDGRARLDRALTAQPANASLRVMAAQFELAADDAAAAERHLKAAVEADPGALPAYSALAQLYGRQNRLDEARGEYEKLVAKQPDAHGARTMIGIIYEAQKRPEDARRVYEQVVEASARVPVAANNLAWRYAETGQNLDKALELAQSAKRQMPDSAEVDDTLGWVYVKKNMPELAVTSLESAVKRAPENAPMLYRLGVAYDMAGRRGDAVKSLERAVASPQPFPEAEEARRMLAALKAR